MGPNVVVMHIKETRFNDITNQAIEEGWKSGLNAALAFSVQIISLMWLHTTMTYEYKFGGQGILKTIKLLKNQGGFRRFYLGIGPALIQGPLGRFGDTATSTFVLTLFSSYGFSHVPMILQTSCASGFAAMWRVCLMPLNTLQTMRQVQGSGGLDVLKQKLRTHGYPVLFHGASGEYASTFGGHLLWFGTYNTLNKAISMPEETKYKIIRNGGIGISAAIVTDICTNWIRVIKTFRQCHTEPITYANCVKSIIKEDGGPGQLFIRGLRTRLAFSCLQGFVFSVMWNLIQDSEFIVSKSSNHHHKEQREQALPKGE